MELVKNREGFLKSSTHRECTKCLGIFEISSKTVTICPKCNVIRVQNTPIAQRMWSRAKTRAKLSGLEFNIKIEDIIIPKVCPILGVDIFEYRGKSGGRPNSPSLDRVDNTIGYIKSNIMVVSHLANMMKSSASPQELLSFAKWVLLTYSYSPTRVNESC